MSDAFISYRRKPSAALAQLIQLKLERDFGIDAYLDTTRTDSTRVQFPQRLMTAIEDAPTFICLLSDSTLDSEWVRKEIWRAYELKKHCIPVFQEAYVPSADSDEAINYLLNFDGVHVLDIKNIYVDQAISDIAALIVRKPKERRLPLMIGIVVVMLVVAGIAGAVLLSGGGDDQATSDITDTRETEVADVPTDTPTIAPTDTEAPPTDTPTSTSTDTEVPPTATSTNTPEPPTATVTPQPGFERVTSNAAWTSQYPNGLVQEFDGVEMVLVPAGCFMMGSEDGNDDETPVHEQCFDEPFWIDRYEVTNAIYGSTGCETYSSDPDQPRNCVNWFDARDYCENRGARLPTEREWEYAARGPDNLAYPWGNDWNPDLANWADTSPDETFDVGSFPDGASWVGARDMSGNVWEWVSTIYDQDRFPYPYVSDDGRENASDTNSSRVLRGGSFFFSLVALRGADRVRYLPVSDSNDLGFRCARSF